MGAIPARSRRAIAHESPTPTNVGAGRSRTSASFRRLGSWTARPYSDQQRRQRQHRLEQLDVEREPERDRAEDQRPAAAARRRADRQPQRGDDEQHHHRVHRVAARGQDRLGRDREHDRRRDPPGGRPHGGRRRTAAAPRRAGERLGQLQRELIPAEELDARAPAARGRSAACRSTASHPGRTRRRRSCATTATCCGPPRRRTRSRRRRRARQSEASPRPR